MHDMLLFVGRFLVVLGIAIALLGLLILVFRHSGIPLPGSLPGDILVQKKNITFYFPLATCIILSILLSIIMYFISGK